MANPISNNKRIAKNTFALYVRMAFVIGVTLYTSRIVLKELGVDDYGLYNVIGGIVVLLSFLNGAMAVTTQRFLSYEMGSDDSDRLRITFTQTLLVHFFIALIALMLAETIGLWFILNKLVIPTGQEGAAFWVYQISVLSFLISIIQAPFNAAIISNERMSIYAYFSIFEVLGKLVIACSLSQFNNDRIIWYAVLILIMNLLVGLAYTAYSFVNFKECRPINKVDAIIIKKLAGFAGWSLFGAMAWAAKGQGLNVLLNLFFGTAVNAAYGVANQVNIAINSFVQNFSTAIAPQIVKTYSAGDYQQTNILIYSGSKISFLLLLIIAFPIYACINPILAIWLVEVPTYSASFIRLILIISLLESFTFAIGTAIQATGKIRMYQTVVGLTLLMSLPLSWLFLKRGFDADIVFYTSIVISLIALIFRLGILKKNIPSFSIRKYVMQVFLPATAIVALCSFSLFVGFLIDEPTSESILIQLPTYFLIGLLFVLMLGLNSQEREHILLLIRKRNLKNNTKS